MAWFGKLAFGSLGMLFGGPLGAILGAALGHQLVDKQLTGAAGPGYGAGRQERINDVASRQAAYFTCFFSLLARMAKADGVVTPEELAVVEAVINNLNMAGEEKAFARRIFNAAKSSSYSIDDFAAQFYDMNRANPAILSSFVDILFQVAAADGVLHPAEEASLNRVKDIFHIPDSQFDSIRARHFKDVEKYYRMLNCTAASTDEEIKKSYRKLVKDFHPDTIIAKGLPDEFVGFATKRFQEIQAAYERVRKERGL